MEVLSTVLVSFITYCGLSLTIVLSIVFCKYADSVALRFLDLERQVRILMYERKNDNIYKKSKYKNDSIFNYTPDFSCKAETMDVLNKKFNDMVADMDTASVKLNARNIGDIPDISHCVINNASQDNSKSN